MKFEFLVSWIGRFQCHHALNTQSTFILDTILAKIRYVLYRISANPSNIMLKSVIRTQVKADQSCDRWNCSSHLTNLGVRKQFSQINYSNIWLFYFNSTKYLAETDPQTVLAPHSIELFS